MKLRTLCAVLIFSSSTHADVQELLKADGDAYFSNCHALSFKSTGIQAACLSAAGNLISSSAVGLSFAYEVNPTAYIKHYHLDTMTAYDMYSKIMIYLAVNPENKSGSLSTIAMDILYKNYPIKLRQKW